VSGVLADALTDAPEVLATHGNAHTSAYVRRFIVELRVAGRPAPGESRWVSRLRVGMCLVGRPVQAYERASLVSTREVPSVVYPSTLIPKSECSANTGPIFAARFRYSFASLMLTVPLTPSGKKPPDFAAAGVR
jgi:hypothetical protein